ncbi:unnamed protein product [Lepeophtheirus salmonis]|uniref:(salmon louse) hypothetical protein n=1 Tax=Lepeophtheirus salmonis TaxID=72036 RepID=A0A7R8CEZ8_LEPSM|nr:unnamed protein product [Lepeophtheirus salmonis]CAF2795639.1 unnamed protein product [Lepeophtheirus salmonis]
MSEKPTIIWPSCIAKHGRLFTDGKYIKEAFLSCAETLFNDLPNKDIITTRIKTMPTSSCIAQWRIDDMVGDVRAQQTKRLTDDCFCLALDKSLGNEIPGLAVVERYSGTRTVRDYSL